MARKQPSMLSVVIVAIILVHASMISATAWVGTDFQSDTAMWWFLITTGILLMRPVTALIRMICTDASQAVRRSYVKNTKGFDVILMDRQFRSRR